MLIRIVALLIALTVHEYAHGRAAYAMGDSTAKVAGRLTLNPLAHIDPIGFLMLWIFRFGWAKPVPINPFYFRNRRQGLILVSAAGPAANIVTAFFVLILLKTILLLGLQQTKLLFVSVLFVPLRQILYQTFIYNLYLAIFNLIPVPPLDGSKILMGLLPAARVSTYVELETYGPILLILLLYFGVIGKILHPAVTFCLTLLDVASHWIVFGGLELLLSLF
ncbi:MAG: site-2 protease family protein [bacterium]